MAPIRLNNNDLGRDAIRWAIAASVAGQGNIQAYAVKRWGRLFVEKSGVSDTEADGMELLTSARAEFVEAFSERNTLGRIRGVLPASFNVRIVTPNRRPTATWTGQSKAIPVGQFDLAGQTLTRKKIASITPFSNESLADPRSEAWIANDVTAKIHEAFDQALLDPSNGGSDETPASITFAAPSSASTGDPADDVKALLADFSGDLSNAAFITDKNTATQLPLYRDTSGIVLFPDATLIGGSILGIPLIVSRHAPNDSAGGNLVLVDGASIAATFENVEFSSTDQALIEQDTAPQGAADTPTAASATFISLWQANMTAIKGVLYADWKVIRRGGVSFVSGTDY